MGLLIEFSVQFVSKAIKRYNLYQKIENGIVCLKRQQTVHLGRGIAHRDKSKTESGILTMGMVIGLSVL